MGNYNASVRQALTDVNLGIRVDRTAELATVVHAVAAYPLFTVAGGRVLLLNIYGEIQVAAFAADASILQFYFTPTAGAQTPLDAVSLTAASLAVGRRLYITGTIGTAMTFGAIGVSCKMATPIQIGFGTTGGVIGIETSVAAMTGTATCKVAYSCWYVPIDAGATIVAV